MAVMAWSRRKNREGSVERMAIAGATPYTSVYIEGGRTQEPVEAMGAGPKNLQAERSIRDVAAAPPPPLQI